MNGKSEHLPIYGPGLAYVAIIVTLTAAVIALSALGAIPVIGAGAASTPLRVLGVACVVGGVTLWVAAAKGTAIDDGIIENRLVTRGVYSAVRNPIYSAFTLACAGTILIFENPWLLVLLPVFWAFLTLLMKSTEEKWLANLYGQEYEDYCARTNRCIPWFPKR